LDRLFALEGIVASHSDVHNQMTPERNENPLTFTSAAIVSWYQE